MLYLFLPYMTPLRYHIKIYFWGGGWGRAFVCSKWGWFTAVLLLPSWAFYCMPNTEAAPKHARSYRQKKRRFFGVVSKRGVFVSLLRIAPSCRSGRTPYTDHNNAKPYS